MPLEREKIRGALLGKGFVEVTKGKDHDFYYLAFNGKKTSVFTKLSRGSSFREIGDRLVSTIARQIGFDKEEFLQYVDCDKNLEHLIERLRSQKRIR